MILRNNCYPGIYYSIWCNYFEMCVLHYTFVCSQHRIIVVEYKSHIRPLYKEVIFFHIVKGESMKKNLERESLGTWDKRWE